MNRFFTFILAVVCALATAMMTFASTPVVYKAAPRNASEVVVIPPFTATFNKTDGLKDYTVIDANNDGKTWKYYNSTAQILYNSDGKTPMDDWLISCPVKLETGRMYEFSIVAYCNETYDDHSDKLEVFIGMEPTVEAMTLNVVPVTEIKALKKNPQTITGSVSVTASGNYYIGVHACSDPDTWAILVSSFTIKPGASVVVPSAVTDLKVVPDPSAALNATISFKAPATDADGNALEGLQTIVISRGDVAVKTLENVEVGQECSYTDDVPEAGNYTYTVMPVIGGSEGTAMSANVYVGLAKPIAPTGITLFETETDGIVTIGWDAVTTNEYGYAMLADLVSYTVMTVEDTPKIIAENIKGTSHTFRAIDERNQTFVEYYVVASTDAGSSAPALSPLIVAGKPYAMPMDIHVTDQGYISHNVSINGDWSLAALSADRNEDGYVFRLTPEINKTSAIGSGKVAIPTDARNPIFTFYYYTWKSGESGPSNDIAYATVNGERVEGCVYPLGASDGWMAAIVPLDAYKGKSVTVGVEIECKPLTGGLWYFPLIDGISVTDPYKNDLMVKSVSVPEYIKGGNKGTVSVSVKNIGSEDAGEFEVELLRNGESVQTVKRELLKAAISTTVEFVETPDASWGEKVEYQVAVNYAMDESVVDNTSASLDVDIFFENYPVVSVLTADTTAPGGTLLSWEAPLLSTENVEITETFENCRAFAIDDVFEWTFFDIDNDKTYSFGGNEDYPGRFAKMAYIVFDASHFSTPADYAAHSGDRYLATFSSYSGKNDDWAVSPLLCGDAQTITFYAKSYNDKYGLETFEVLATPKADNFTTEDFEIVGEKCAAPTSWKKYSFTLPAGSRHFAIHCNSEDKFFFQVDDVTFTAAPETERFAITGYNVYRNKEKLNSEPVDGLTFVDASGTADATDYRVSAVYADGESRLSVPASDLSGIAAPASDTVSVFAADGAVSVRCQKAGIEVSVYTAAGILVGKGTTDGGVLRIPVAAGVYVVKAGGTVAKVIVY